MPKTADEAFSAWEKRADELAEITALHRKAVGTIGKTTGRAKWRATEAAERIREALAEALGAETRAGQQFATLSQSPDLFAGDNAPPAPAPRGRAKPTTKKAGGSIAPEDWHGDRPPAA